MGLNERNNKMSQIVRAITAHKTGDRKVLNDVYTPLFIDMVDIESKISKQTLIDTDIAVKYRIMVNIGADVLVSEAEQEETQGMALAESIKRTKRHVVEAIFGEFRHDLMMIQRALYDRDFKKSKDLLLELELKMFEVD